MATEPIQLRDGPWSVLRPLVEPVRIAVFVHEQGVPRELEWDNRDATAWHWAGLRADGTAVAAARLLPDWHVGRMAVLAPWRGRGLGCRLLAAIIDHARDVGAPALHLAAQLHALPFYESLGFNAHGEVFLDAGIEHRMMQRRLTDQ